jgi:hypothetical protein
MSEKADNERFVGLPSDWIPNPGFQECPANALKVLVAIVHCWVDGGFKHNGNLIITYQMLRIATGISSKNAIALALRQLEALGILAVDRGKWTAMTKDRQPNRYRLPWLPCDGRPGGTNGGPPTREYLEIKTRAEAKQRIKGLKEKRKDPRGRKLRLTLEFDGI